MNWQLFKMGGDKPVTTWSYGSAGIEPQRGDLLLITQYSDAQCFRVLDRIFGRGIGPALLVEEVQSPIRLPAPPTKEEVEMAAKASAGAQRRVIDSVGAARWKTSE